MLQNNADDDFCRLARVEKTNRAKFEKLKKTAIVGHTRGMRVNRFPIFYFLFCFVFDEHV